jgi:L-alanine-DL-glutamate epimerase-like enolase superfamily enzyme
LPESDGTLEWTHTTIVIVEAEGGGVRGLGYTYADLSTAVLIRSLLAEVVRGRDALDVQGAWIGMVRAIRNLGRPGIASMAISAVDIALWDLKAQLLKVPLAKLFGMVRKGVPIYGSGGFTSYSVERLKAQLTGWAESGISMVKMKVGRDPKDDFHRVRCARECVTDRIALFVDANGAYDRKQALEFSRRFEELRVAWFEEPVSSDDLDGLRLLRDQGPAGMDIAAGEYGYDSPYFRRMLEAGAVDVLQADATRCGGFTGFLDAGSLCFSRSMPLSAHTAPLAHLHVCCAVQAVKHLEYFHDHARIESLFFDGAPKPQNGELHPELDLPGLGVQLRRADLAPYALE